LMSMDNVEKPKVKRSSLYDVKLTADKIPTGAAYNYLGFADALQNCISIHAQTSDGDVFPDDIDWDQVEASSFLGGVGDVLDHMFDVSTKSTRTDELHTAMNLPIICALNAYVPVLPKPANIAIIGADRGQNITQCVIANGKVPLDATYWCVEPNVDAYVQARLRDSLEGCEHHLSKETLCDAITKGFFRKNGIDVKFDMIIHNLGMHVLCPSVMDRLIYAHFIDKHLATNGRALITSIDVDSVIRCDDLGLQSPSRSLQLLQEYPPSDNYVEGMAIIRINATVFRDPILSVGNIFTMFNDTSRVAVTVPGKYLFREVNKFEPSYLPNFQIPKFHLNASRRPELSSVLYTEIHNVDPDGVDYLCPLREEMCFPVWTEVDAFTPNEMARCCFPLNHGRALLPTDLILMNGHDVSIAPKVNGVSARVAIQRGVALMITDNNKFYKASLLDSSFSHDIQVQVEVVYDNEHGFFVVALDPYRLGVRSPLQFIDRWKLFEKIYRVSLVLPKLFKLQTYMPCSPVVFAELREYIDDDDRYDGIVLQNHWALPGSFKHGLGSARYLKSVYTVDVKVDKEIYEVDVDKFLQCDREPGAWLNVREFQSRMLGSRLRTDKLKPNTYAQLMGLRNALTYDQWVDHMSIDSVSLTVDSVPVLTKVLLEGLELTEVPLDECILVYRARHRDYEYVRGICNELTYPADQVFYNIYLDAKARVIKYLIYVFQRSLRISDLGVDSFYANHGVKFNDRIVVADNQIVKEFSAMVDLDEI